MGHFNWRWRGSRRRHSRRIKREQARGLIARCGRMTRLLNQANQDMCGGSPFPTPGNTSQNRQHLGSAAARTPEFLDKRPPAGRWGFFVAARNQQPQTPSSEEVDYERGRRSQEASVNLSGQLKEVHDLG